MKQQSTSLDPQLTLTPITAPVDQPIAIRVTGLQGGEAVAIAAHLHDDEGKRWQAQAHFRADEAGVIDLTTQPPLTGSYMGVDGMGLFWSMALDPAEPDGTPFKKRTVDPMPVTFQVEQDGHVVATAVLDWLCLPPNVARTSVRTDGLVGTFFAPTQGGPYPGVLIFGGSGGGLSEVQAALLAGHGYATLALAYFAYEDLPLALHNIPLEYFERALTWLQAQPSVRADRLAVMGASRGGELALLLGATFPQINAVVAYVPSDVGWEGIGRGLSSNAPAWSYQGVPFPVMADTLTAEQINAVVAHKPIATTPLYLILFANPAAIEAAAIPVERSHAAILLISGQDDQMWPSSLMADRAMARLARYGYAYPYQHLSYPNAGHQIGLPHLPKSATYGRHALIGEMYDYGGTAAGNAFASADSWQQVLRTLDQQLRQ